ncbi:hypothetical protein NBRC116585_13790 [Thalassolituus maritimus]|uniref:Uncharacterized protein n=1 Tax=Thalassolituus maritimus TaxID=484498 RepID=A0ABP9ZYP9_9GAMM
MGVNQPKAIRDSAVTIASPVGALQPACLAMREKLKGLPPVGGKHLPDIFPTKIAITGLSPNSLLITFPVGANQPKAIRDYAATIAPL